MPFPVRSETEVTVSYSWKFSRLRKEIQTLSVFENPNGFSEFIITLLTTEEEPVKEAAEEDAKKWDGKKKNLKILEPVRQHRKKKGRK